jgi:hypothetical protein
MASKYDAKTSAIETHDNRMGENYRKTGDDSGMEMNYEQTHIAAAENEREVLEHAILALEQKKTTWYAYFTTVDFWIVLALG